MGLSSQLKDVSSDSIPILLVVAAAEWISYLRSLIHCLLHSLGLLRLRPADHDHLFPPASIASGLAGLLLLADHLKAAAPFPFDAGDDAQSPSDCVVCLSALADGRRLVRRLPACRHVFHVDCLDGWFDQMNLSCPLCRYPLAPDDRRADAERRIAAWLSPHSSTRTSL